MKDFLLDFAKLSDQDQQVKALLIAKSLLSKDDYAKMQITLNLEKAVLLFCDYDNLTFMVSKVP